MPFEVLLFFFVVLELCVKLVFRWRTWRDRGIALAVVTIALGVLLFTAIGDAAAAALKHAIAEHTGSLFVPVLAATAGFLGMNPFLFALLAAVAQPDRQLLMNIVLPMALGNLPQTIFVICTMPPRGD